MIETHTRCYVQYLHSLGRWIDWIICLLAQFLFPYPVISASQGRIQLQSYKLIGYNVAYGLLTVGGFLTGLNIKTSALKCLTADIFLTKGITQRFPRYIHCRTTADSAGGSSRCCWVCATLWDLCLPLSCLRNLYRTVLRGLAGFDWSRKWSGHLIPSRTTPSNFEPLPIFPPVYYSIPTTILLRTYCRNAFWWYILHYLQVVSLFYWLCNEPS